MLIHFKCRRCRKPLALEAHLAGSPQLCPVCKGEVLVPAVSDPQVLRDLAAQVQTSIPTLAVPPPPVVPPVAIIATPPPPAVVTAPPEKSAEMSPLIVRRPWSQWRTWVVAGAILVLAGGLVFAWAAYRRGTNPSKPEEPTRVAVAQDKNDPSVEESEDTGLAFLRPDTPRGPAGFGSGLRLVPRGEEMEDQAKKPDPPTVEKPAEPKPTPAPAARTFPRRQKLSEEELVKQLTRSPEVGISSTNVQTLLQAYQNDFQTRLHVTGTISVEPTVLLQIRPDLKGMPVLQGKACQMDPASAVTLQNLSQKLRIYLQAAVPRNPDGKRPDPALLRQALRLEMNGPRPEWLKAEAIPTMNQLLMHEDPSLRLMFVDMLSEIKGPVATGALAQRAVFDLSPEVRTAAIQALKDRPREEIRPWLFYGLRYPWAPAADHAAETLVALEDRATIPQLITLLKQPDPTCPTTPSGSPYLVREVVRANHLNNCLLCHPPGITGNEPSLGLDPVVRVPVIQNQATRVTQNQLSTVNRILATPGSHGYGSAPTLTPVTQTTVTQRNGTVVTQRVVPVPVLIRGDVTYLRQDFSVQLPVPQPVPPPVPVPGVQPTPNQRFDYMVRMRLATSEEMQAMKERLSQPEKYPQRDAVLFALRELSGQDPGASTSAWVGLFPQAETDVQAAHLATQLLHSVGNRKDYWIDHLRDAKGVVHTQALAIAIPKLKGADQDKAREALVQRMGRMSLATLKEKLQDESVEIRRAAALACAKKDDLSLIPDLVSLLEDREPPVVQSARSALKTLTGEDFGPKAEATQADRDQAVVQWLEWWRKQGQP